MDVLPLVTSDPELASALAPLIEDGRPGREVKTVEPARALEYLGVETPKLYLLDFDDPGSGAFALLEQIMADPWLHHGGILALCDAAEKIERLEELRRANVVAVVGRGELETLPRLLRGDVRRSSRRRNDAIIAP